MNVTTEIAMPAFFRGQTLTRETRPLVLDGGPAVGLRLPDPDQPLVLGADAAGQPGRGRADPPGRAP
jgi:hypothetical protein